MGSSDSNSNEDVEVKAEHEELVDELLELVKNDSTDWDCDRAMAMRFLVARKFSVPKAWEQLSATLKWQKEIGYLTILDTPDPLEENFQRLCKHGPLSFDREGHPTWWEQPGRVNQAAMWKEMDPEAAVVRHVRRHATQERRMNLASKHFGRLIEQAVYVLDLAGLPFSPDSRGFGVFRKTIEIDQNYFPERLAHFFFLNSPWVFKPLWALASPFIDKKTKTKFHLLGTDYHDTLLRYFDPSQIPEEYGGTLPWPQQYDPDMIYHQLGDKKKKKTKSGQ